MLYKDIKGVVLCPYGKFPGRIKNQYFINPKLLDLSIDQLQPIMFANS